MLIFAAEVEIVFFDLVFVRSQKNIKMSEQRRLKILSQMIRSSELTLEEIRTEATTICDRDRVVWLSGKAHLHLGVL